MNIIQPRVELKDQNWVELLQNIEENGRVCYKTEDAISPSSYKPFLEKIMGLGHHSMFEHEKVTARIICDRGVSHEIVRHRIAAYSQESTRYCNYVKEKFGKEITVIEPFFFMKDSFEYLSWKNACENSEASYFYLVDHCKRSAQEARSVLPNSLKTEIVVTYNLREWRHFFSLRADKAAHSQMQQVAIPLLLEFKRKLSPLFDDIKYNLEFCSSNYAEVIIREKGAF